MCSLGMLHAVGSISSSEKMGMGGEEKEQEEKEENAKNRSEHAGLFMPITPVSERFSHHPAQSPVPLSSTLAL